jgi:hypothetical protein
MPIQRSKPHVEPEKVFDEWYMTRFEVYPDAQGPWRCEIEFVAAHDTGEPLLDADGNPKLAGDGTPRTRYELLRNDSRRVVVDDLNAVALAKAAAGDLRLLQALGLTLQLAAEHALETGAID